LSARSRRASAGVALALAAVLSAACGGEASGGQGAEVEIKGPDLRPRRVAIRTLEPGATPTPAPTPPPATPTPTPGPTPTPLPPPGRATINSAAGVQEGAPASFCWSASGGGPSECYDHPRQEQPQALPVRRGEVALVRLEAARPPDEESVRPFKGSRSNYPSIDIEAALETELTIDLDPGEWEMDLCATWHGHGQPICWLFRFQVEA
jgi:hypothetical protein